MLRAVQIIFLLLPLLATAQFTLTGPKGMINVPHAEVLEDGAFMFGMHTNHKAYRLLTYGDRKLGSEYISIINLGFLSRINVSLSLSRVFGDPLQVVNDKSSIGDRNVQVSALLVKESEFLPALVVNIADPFYSSNQFLSGNYLVASKSILNANSHNIMATLGYGFPFQLVFSGQEKRVFVRNQSNYLTDLFGGISYRFLPANLQVSLEYDGWNVNTGIGITLWERLSLQSYLQGMKYPGVGFNYVGIIH